MYVLQINSKRYEARYSIQVNQVCFYIHTSIIILALCNNIKLDSTTLSSELKLHNTGYEVSNFTHLKPIQCQCCIFQLQIK